MRGYNVWQKYFSPRRAIPNFEGSLAPKHKVTGTREQPKENIAFSREWGLEQYCQDHEIINTITSVDIVEIIYPTRTMAVYAIIAHGFRPFLGQRGTYNSSSLSPPSHQGYRPRRSIVCSLPSRRYITCTSSALEKQNERAPTVSPSKKTP